MNTNTEPISRRIAHYFLEHLNAELHKHIVKSEDFDDRSALEINRQLLDELLTEYKGLENDPEPRFSLFRRWFEINKFPVPYDEFSTEAYNIIFMERLRCLRNWSPEAIQKFHDVIINIFSKFNYRREGFSVSNFLKFENNMRELLREVMRDLGPEVEGEIWPILYEQSTRFQEIVNEFFENILKEAFAESERLLNNILPVQVSDELKKKGRVKPVLIESATVLFTDFKGFTQLSEQMSPEMLVQELDECFSVFDGIIERFGLEKIKTIGDSFMCVGGLPEQNKTHIFDAALSALAMQREIGVLQKKREARGLPYWQARIGFHTGPLVAGVIGQKKFSYDIWGDTVNIASRMESSGAPGRINISETSADLLRPFFNLEDRGSVAAKNKGSMRMYFLKGLRKSFSSDADGTEPNSEFMRGLEAIRTGKKIKIGKREK